MGVFYLNNSGHRFIKRPNPLLVHVDPYGKEIGKPFKAKYYDSGTAWVVAVKHNGERITSYKGKEGGQ